ncbi:hypothetical protein BX600DRAFT_81466 [Xylariales sp. PMI_506]|nr:hypothetical protein BX600DRAFT_81466 [Xylariales sp. PMI_506]
MLLILGQFFWRYKKLAGEWVFGSSSRTRRQLIITCRSLNARKQCWMYTSESMQPGTCRAWPNRQACQGACAHSDGELGWTSHCLGITRQESSWRVGPCSSRISSGEQQLNSGEAGIAGSLCWPPPPEARGENKIKCRTGGHAGMQCWPQGPQKRRMGGVC